MKGCCCVAGSAAHPVLFHVACQVEDDEQSLTCAHELDVVASFTPTFAESWLYLCLFWLPFQLPAQESRLIKTGPE